MNLSTDYLGLHLRNPLVVGASPCCDDLDLCRRLEDSGASALVMHSLFEEQVDLEDSARQQLLDGIAESHSEAADYFPHYEDYSLTPDLYLRQLLRLKSALRIPVIASLNGYRPGGWIDHARRIEDAGADALELNLYSLPTDPEVDADAVETELLFIVREVVNSVNIPVAVKLSPWLTAPANFVRQLELAGAKGAVMFNRFYQPDFSIEDLDVHPQLRLSDSSELLLRLRWLAIVSPQTQLSLAASGGVHTSSDFIKALLAGADIVQVVSSVLRHGACALPTLLNGLQAWMREHEYTSVDQVRGALNLSRCPQPAAHERANYLNVLQSWRV
ncbi:MAG: dihydroorotate dehydrogenase-like protein [Burkholderiales bacterium]|nr:dihydroorotate dehydrogenase-like protein [Opitutaceae bacterium]